MQPAHLSEPVFTRLSNSVWAFSQDYWRLVVVAMLATLHVAVFRGVADPWARALLLVHLGLLLLWQPFLRAEQRISLMQGFILSLVAFAVMMALDWWLLAFWVVVLAGLVGGKVYQHRARWQRLCYLVVLAYLLALLAVVILPEIAPSQEITPEIRSAAEYLLPLAFVLILLLPAEPEQADTAQVIDFFYSVFLMLLLVVVILGSFTFMTLRRTGYLEALTYTVFLTAGAVLLVGLAWNPRSGFAGLNVFFVRYLFSIGLPVEQWLHFLAELLQREARPERFLVEALSGLARLPSVSGVSWKTAEASGEEGERTPHAVDFENSAVSLRIYSRYRLSPALLWHLRLLGELLGEFYMAKLREEQLRQASYVQAVHETGARMTHDIKNLLQSLNVLCSVAARDHHRDSAGLPRSLFDSVADNLIRNALAKRTAERGTRVRVSLACDGSITLRVRDSGSAVPPEMENTLLRAPVDSASGLGIGLYQAARQAESSGYQLALETNLDGDVCFALTGSAA